MPTIQRQQGFSLLEMSIVLSIIAVMMTGGMVMFAASLNKKQYKDTEAKMQALQDALLNYRLTYNRIPCPADVTRAVDDQYFGVEAATPGTCTGGTPTANFNNGNNVEGMVPTKTLRLPDDYAFDSWGRRIMYAVDINFTADKSFFTIGASDTTPRMTINDSSGTAKTNLAIYALVSFSANGHGAYPRVGGATRINVGSTNLDEQNNCDCNNLAAPGTFDGVYVQKLPTSNPASNTDSFDDIVRYDTRADMLLQTE